MKKNTTELLLAFFILLTCTAYGQAKKKGNERDTTEQWKIGLDTKARQVEWSRFEVGIDLLWLINKNNVPPSFFIKKIDLKQKQKGFGFVRRGYRLRLGGNYERPNESARSNLSPFLNQTSYSFILRPGYEWHTRIKSWNIFYGFDLNTAVSGFEASHVFLSIYSNPNSLQQIGFLHQRITFIKTGLSPVIGANINVYKNIGVSIESTVDLYYLQRRYSYIGNPSYDDVKASGGGFGVNAIPLYTLNISLSF